MQNGLKDVLRKNTFEFIIWLLANIGGLVIAYAAILTIYIFSNLRSNYYPGPDDYLLIATVSVTISGVTYSKNFIDKTGFSLNRVFLLGWPILLALVYGVLIVFGMKPPPYENWVTRIGAGVIFILCMAWSSIVWLSGKANEPPSDTTMGPTNPPPDMVAATNELPKMEK
jgi:hypothetical protein